MSNVLDKPNYQHSAIENFLWSSPFSYQILFKTDSCLQSGKTIVEAVFRDGFPERKLVDPAAALTKRSNKSPLKDRSF